MFEKYIDSLKDEIISETCNLINIPSISEETNNPNMPFGVHAKESLEYALNLGSRLGFRTKNIDGYCGYIEFGEGDKLIGIIGHLDVVPAGDGWDTSPFIATIKDNKIYGRGALDDKGPVVASLYAMKTIKDNMNVNCRVRLILGINEEKAWKCIKHYKEVEELPSISFSPDADFPCIYAEKGICTIYIKDDYSKYENLPIKISNIDCNNNAINVVPKKFNVTLDIDTSKISLSDITDFIDDELKTLNFEINYSINDNSMILHSTGIQAHSAHPDLGKNAISPVLILLNRIFNHFEYEIKLFNFFEKYISTEFNGKSLGLDFEDESGKLTLNVGNFKFYENYLQIGINFRIPINTSIDIITNSVESQCKNYSLETYIAGKQNPLYVPKNNHLVQTLCSIFNKMTNSNLEPIAIGGATFARAFENCVSFGANFPGDTDMCHQSNESIDIDKLVLSCKIYAEAIYELSK
mgnify:FL=1